MAAFIRPYKPSDFEATAHICRATLPPALAGSEAGTRLAPYLWTHQYTHLTPAHCFVLDDGGGRCVGYVIGCPDVFVFAARYPSYVRQVLNPLGPGFAPRQMDELEPWSVDGVINEQCLLQTARTPRWLLLEGVEGKRELVASYRATMHIDMLEEWQGQGWGRKMIERFVQSVRDVQGQTVRVSGDGDDDGDEGTKEMVLDHGSGIHIGVAGENRKVVPFYEKVGFRVYPGGEKEGGNVWMVYDL